MSEHTTYRAAPAHTSAHTTPRRPAEGSARAAVLDALLSGRALTSRDAWREFGASRLAADVHELRRMGWTIIADEVDAPTRRGGTARIARYRLAA